MGIPPTPFGLSLSKPEQACAAVDLPTSRVSPRRTPHLRKRKATRWSGEFLESESQFAEPSARPAGAVHCTATKWASDPITQPAVLAKSGVRHKLGYRLKQVPALIRFSLRSSAQPDEVGDEPECGETMTRFARHGLRAGCVSFPLPGTDSRQPSRQHHSLIRLDEVSSRVAA